MKILVCDPISQKGIELFQSCPEFDVQVLDRKYTEEELLPLVADVHAMVVRSETQITSKVMDSAPNLRVVGRAGVGVDNVDVEAATQRGIAVMNTPGGNTISTAELTFSMLMALARNIPQAHQTMKEGLWNRKHFKGVELNGKALGIIGLGRIGAEVAKRAMAFGMSVLAYDPYLTHARAKALQVELVELDDMYARADFITVHIPKTEETAGMLNKDAFAKMKPGVRLLNCARGGIINEDDLADAIEAGKVAGAALDVYEVEPPPADFKLRKLPQVIMTPHLGASTTEAQINVGIEVAEIITDYLVNGAVQNAVNLPSLDAKTYERVKPYLQLAEKLGAFIAQIAPKRNDKLVITYGGKATELPADPITRFALKGFLKHVGGSEVNQVNVRTLAGSLGLLVEEVKSSESTDYNEWLHLALYSGDKKVSVGGALFGARLLPRFVRINSCPVEVVPEGAIFLMNNKDRPGMVGQVGSLFGKHKINIASMSLSRENQEGGQALTVFNLDSVPSEDALREIESDPDISNVRVAQL